MTSINPDNFIQDVELLVRKAVKKALKELEYDTEVKDMDLIEKSPKFEETEKLLFQYLSLKETIERTRNLPDVEKVTRNKEFLIAYVKALHIEKAIECIQNDKFFPIIEEYYFNNKSDKDLSAILHRDQSAIFKHRCRLINDLSIALFGIDALDLD